VGWNPRLFDRKYCDHASPVVLSDEKILDKADQAWRNLVAGQLTEEPDPSLVKQVDRIVEAAKKDLLSEP
jgi:hypothetical protein